MLRGKGRLAAITVSALFLGLAPASSASAENNQCWDYTGAEKRFKNRINDERLDVALGKLKLDPELSKVARKHTKEMLQADKGLFHSTSEQFHNRISNWTLVGENVGYGGGVESLHDAFMDSPGHAANVLHVGYTFVGVGARRDEDGTLWVTIIFSGTENPGTSLQMPDC